MSDLSDWIQSYWFELGSLLLQLATLTALVWFARGLLRVLMTFQGRTDALNQAPARLTEPTAEGQPFSSGLRGLIPMDSAPSYPRARAAYVGPGSGGLWHSIVKWLNTPMGHAPVAWRRWEIHRIY